jgi:hypothetical protein
MICHSTNIGSSQWIITELQEVDTSVLLSPFYTLGFTKGKKLALGHIAIEWKSRDLSPSQPG